MIIEVQSAVDFVANMLRTRVNENQAEAFSRCLNNTITNHYQGHWFPEKPFKGSGYRCIRINHKMDPLVLRAGTEIGLSESDLFGLLPSELTLWVDPDEVSYRIGEEGSVGVLFDASGKLTAQTEPDDDYSPPSSPLSSSSSSSGADSPTGFLDSLSQDQLNRYYGGSNSGGVSLEFLAQTYMSS